MINKEWHKINQKKDSPEDYSSFFENLSWENRRGLAKVLTIVENENIRFESHFIEAISKIGTQNSAMKIGISGSPGVGKSSFIEILGQELIKTGNTIAILAIDPSSKKSKGSILGDKTRMEMLSKNAKAFIRPSPNVLSKGGIRSSSFFSMKVCEAAGFDFVIIETVGVGQSEFEVRNIVDLNILLLNPAGGDDLQSIKKGSLELADMVIMNKSDGNYEHIARERLNEITQSLNLTTGYSGIFKSPKTYLTSCVNKSGFEPIVKIILDVFNDDSKLDFIKSQRTQQELNYFENYIQELIQHIIWKDPEFQKRFEKTSIEIQDKKTSLLEGINKLSSYLKEYLR